MNKLTRRTATALTIAVILGIATLRPASTAPQDDARALFEHFVAAQNAHDAAAVEAMLWDSADFLWITRGAPIWGRAAAMERFRANYQGTWALNPDMTQFRAVTVADGTIQLFVPMQFMIGPPGQPAQPVRFLMTQTLVRTSNGWRITAILPIPLPPS